MSSTKVFLAGITIASGGAVAFAPCPNFPTYRHSLPSRIERDEHTLRHSFYTLTSVANSYSNFIPANVTLGKSGIARSVSMERDDIITSAHEDSMPDTWEHPIVLDLTSTFVAMADEETLGALQSLPHTKRAADLSTWKRRLITKEDSLGLHKISGLSQTVAAIAIFATGASSGFQDLPSNLEPMINAFCLSMLLQCITSFRLADSHRKREIGVRNVFMNMSVSCLIIAVSALWISPFSPDFFDTPVISKATFSLLPLLNIWIGLDAFVNFDNLMESQTRHDKRGGDNKWMRAFITTVPYLFTVPINIVVMVSIGFYYDRLSFLDLLHSGAVDMNDASIFYESVLAAIGISYFALFVTLRDKKLIGKDTEIMLTTCTAVFVLTAMIDQAKVLISFAISQI